MSAKPGQPLDERERLAVLASYAILDTEPEAEFDALTTLAASIFGTPIALVSLIDEHRQWFKSRVGVEPTETPRESAFCAHAIQGDSVFVVRDACGDTRFRNHELVTGATQARFYAGAPLIDDAGQPLGTLCVIDCVPREPSSRQLEHLRLLADQVVRLLELRRVARRLAETLDCARTLARLIPICAHCRRLRDDRGEWTSVELYLEAAIGVDFTHGICPTCYRDHYPDPLLPPDAESRAE